MRICLIAPPPSLPGLAAASGRLSRLLTAHHEVVVIESDGEPIERFAGLSYAGPEHRHSVAVLDAIRAAYGASGPDYLEVPDAGAQGLVALQARESGDPLLADTLVGVRVSPSAELLSLHDRMLSQPAPTRAAELEREQLRLADRLIWPGGDTLELYRRYYDGLALPEPVRIGLPVEPAEASDAAPARDPGAPLRILFADELRRNRGVLDLVEACLCAPVDGWELTLIGADTATATMGQSVRLTIEAMAGEDPRITIEDPVSAERLRSLLPAYDLLVVPSTVEAWSEAVVEAARAGLPVLATPVGGLVEIVEDGITGWHTDGLGADSIGRALARLLADRGELERVRASGAIAAHAGRLADPAPVLAAYESLSGAVPPRPAGAPATPDPETLVTGVIPYYGVPEYIGDAVASLLCQTHRNLEVLIVNDGSFAEADGVLDEFADDPRVRVVTQPNTGESTARNLGALLARGEYLVMLDADNVLEPGFVERALRAFARNPELAYVSCWLRMMDTSGTVLHGGYGYAPLGNAVLAADTENWDGDTLAMLPRRLFTELGYCYGPGGSMHSDWELYRWLRREGRFGVIVPALLARYRVRPDSLLRAHSEQLQDRGWAESRDRNLQRQMRWIAGG